jgi:uncharacterized membrane protein
LPNHFCEFRKFATQARSPRTAGALFSAACVWRSRCIYLRSGSNIRTRIKLKEKTIMAELIVVGFKKDMFRASEVLNELLDMNDEWVVDLHDAVAVYREYKGKLRVDRSYQATAGEGAAYGGLIGLMIGATLAIPFTAGLSAAAAAGAIAAGAVGGTALGAGAGALDSSSWKDEFGIPDDFIKRVSATVQPGDSAVFAVLRVGDPQVVADHFRGYGGEILRTTLSREQQDKVERVLAGRAS